jgi:hypothetical protein
MSARIELTGLRANAAHGYLAALGVVESLYRERLSPQLSWTDGFVPVAVLTYSGDIEDLIDAVLRDRDRRTEDFVLNFPPGRPFDTLERTPNEMVAWAECAAGKPNDHPDLDLWSALVVEGGLTAAGQTKSTHFDFTTGQVKFLKIVRTIGANLDRDLLREALLGPWKYGSELSTLRFEAEGERLQALRGVPPTADKVRGVPGADWLAFLGLSFYPLSTRPGRDRARVVTPACDADWSRSAYRWVTWRQPLGRRTIAALVTDPDVVGEDAVDRHIDPRSLAARGLQGVWESSIIRTARGYGAFGPPKSIARAAIGQAK